MTEATAVCRGCRRTLRGKPYHMGGDAYLPDGSQAKFNHYGGFVCSEDCDHRASLEQERSMPGHGDTQTSIGCYARESLNRNWR